MEVHFQFAGKDILAKSVLDQAVEAYKNTHKDVEIKEVELYIVAEEGAAYYVVTVKHLTTSRLCCNRKSLEQKL